MKENFQKNYTAMRLDVAEHILENVTLASYNKRGTLQICGSSATLQAKR
jgi:hypothetical protein